MYLLRRLILWLIPTFWIVGLELVRVDYEKFWYFVVGFLLYLIAAIFLISKANKNKILLNFLILPVFFAMSSITFLLFMVNEMAFHFVTVLTGVVLYLIINQYYIYFNFPFKYQPYSLESLNFYTSILTFFLLFSGGFASLILLKFNKFLLIGSILPIMVLLLYQFFWIHKIKFKKSWIFVFSIVVVVVELLAALAYLPTSYYVNSFVLTICCYLMLGFSKGFLQETLDKKRIISYLSVGSILTLITLLTAQWG